MKKLSSLFPFFLVFYEVTNYLANDMYLPALPQITTYLHTTIQSTQQTLTIWFLGTASLSLFLGPLSDRLGRRPVLFAGGFLFILSTWFCMTATNIYMLLIARFFQGCAVCFVVTAGYASIHEIYDHIKAIKILATMGSITVLAPAFGPLLGSIILQSFSWRWIFGIQLIWALIALVALWFLMPESNPKKNRHSLHWKKLLSNYFVVLSNPIFMRNTLMFCLTFLGMIAWIAAGPFLVITKFHFSTLAFGIFQAMIFGSLIIGAQVVNYLVKKIAANRLIDWGLAISLVGAILAFFLTLFFPHILLGLVVGLMIFTFGASLAFSPSHRIAIEACSTVPMGARMAVFSTLMSLFGFIGGLIVSLTYTGTLLWFGVLLLVVISGAYLTMLGSKKVL